MISPRKCALPIIAFALFAASGIYSASAEDCAVQVGVAGPMSGGAAAYGLNEKLGAEFQAALANEGGGLQIGDKKCKVNILSYDSGYTSAGGAAAANYLASQGVHVVLGPIGTPEVEGFKSV